MKNRVYALVGLVKVLLITGCVTRPSEIADSDNKLNQDISAIADYVALAAPVGPEEKLEKFEREWKVKSAPYGVYAALYGIWRDGYLLHADGGFKGEGPLTVYNGTPFVWPLSEETIDFLKKADEWNASKSESLDPEWVQLLTMRLDQDLDDKVNDEVFDKIVMILSRSQNVEQWIEQREVLFRILDLDE